MSQFRVTSKESLLTSSRQLLWISTGLVLSLYYSSLTAAEPQSVRGNTPLQLALKPEQVSKDKSKQQSPPQRPPKVEILQTIAEGAVHDVELHRVTVTGTARTVEGKPLKNAEIYLTSENWGFSRNFNPLRGKTRTDATGYFELKDIQLLVTRERPNPIPKQAEARFAVFGTCAGYGFTWHASCRYRPAVRPQGTEISDKNTQETARAFYLNEPIQVDLTFDRPAKLQGLIMDKQGRPLPHTKVQLGLIDSLRNPKSSGTWSCQFLGNENQPVKTPVAFSAIRLLPAELRETYTNADGYYEFTQLRRDTSYLTNIDPGPAFDPWHLRIATAEKVMDQNRREIPVGYDGLLSHEFVAPRLVNVQITHEKTGQPVSDVLVTAHPARQQRRGGIQSRSDSQGNARLQLLPGEYKLIAEPAPNQPFCFQSGKLAVSEKTDEVVHPLKLKPAAIVILKAVNAETGKPIPNVSFNYETDSSSRPLPVSTQTVFVDYPQTNAAGEIQVFVVPGKKRFVVAEPLTLAQAEASRGELLQLKGGEVTKVRFELTPPQFLPAHLVQREFKPNPNHIFPAELQIKWHAQSELAQQTPLRITTDRLLLSRKPIDTRALLKELRALPPDQVPDIDRLLMKYQSDQLVWSKLILTSERNHFREDHFYSPKPGRPQIVDFEGKPVPDSIQLYTGWDSLAYHIGNNQADAYQERRRWLHLGTVKDLCEWPYLQRIRRTASGKLNLEKPDVKISKSDKTTTYETASSARTRRYVIDNQTGCVLESSYGADLENPDRIDLYFAPTTYPGGLILPRAHLSWNMYRGKLRMLTVYLVKNVEVFSQMPADAFAVSLPAGATLVDYRSVSLAEARSGRRRPEQHIFSAPISDFAAYLQRHPPKIHQQDNQLQPGMPAPELKPAQWVTSEGKSGPPDLKGKVVLIEFWGTRCGPCLSQLPEVRTAARYYADQPFVLIGMHDSYINISDLQKFAQKENLKYQLAIDRPATEKGWFGETMRQYDIHGIPKAAVIDQQGNIAFVGYFKEALKTVDRLLKKETSSQ
ncbi:Thiol-disulfide oxidoreductase ResA [Gimesia panareensis]|uniref:Thiol-disulfide oxidoreductase ResA n=1 Tax=Gimesia panareensis TaxID=2527978 RepID=A0A517QCP7_9PLAN|nr:redoxin family protein [Gimesia panareensis]QDT29406.1 Thiol-disulfide oxidoreductase ResA [Gimesia panareensis]